MGNDQCKRKQERKRLIMVNKSKVFIEKLNSLEGQNVFIEQPNEVNKPFQDEYREPFDQDIKQLCMLTSIKHFEERILERKDIRIESVNIWHEPDMCLVFYSEDNRSRRTVPTSAKAMEDRDEKVIGVDLNFDSPQFKDQLKQVVQSTKAQMFIGHALKTSKPGTVTLYFRQSSDLQDYKVNDGIEVEEVSAFDKTQLLDLVQSKKENESLYLKSIIIDPSAAKRYAVFEKHHYSIVIKFFTVHEYKAPAGKPTNEFVENELNKLLTTWDSDCGLYRVIVNPPTKTCFFVFKKTNIMLSEMGNGM